MISVFKKGTPQIVGGLGDGTMQNPYFWYAIAENTAVTDLSKLAISYNYVHIKVNLTAGQTYSLYCNTGGNFDGYMRLYDIAGTQLDENDDYNGTEDCAIEFTPDTTGDYIIGLGSYDDGGAGTFTSCTVEPAPNTVELPEITYRYPTSSGFNAIGKPVKYRSAIEAGCSTKLPIPTDGLIRYAPLDKYYENTTPGESYFCPVGNVTFETVDGVPSAYFGKADGYRFMQAYFLESPDGFTCSFWCKNMETIGTVAFCVCNSNCSNYDFTMWMNKTSASFSSGDSLVGADFEDNGKIRHFSLRYSSGILDLFLDGSLIASWEFTLTIVTDQYYTQIAKKTYYSSQPVNGLEGYVSSFRIYNRALSDKEVKALSREFNV